MNTDRLTITETKLLYTLDAFYNDGDSLYDFIDKLQKCYDKCSNRTIIKDNYSGGEIHEVIERKENDKEYGKRIGKEKNEYNQYLKLKAKFEKD